MTILATTYETTGWVSYDTLTGQPAVGEVVTGAAGGEGVIISIERTGTTAGHLYIGDWNRTNFVDAEAFTGSEDFAAKVKTTTVLDQRVYYYVVDTSASTTNWGLGTNYSFMAEFTEATSTLTRREYEYFDISFLPAVQPNITSEEIDALYPLYKKFRPESWADNWVIPIKRAHADLVNRIRLHDELAASFVKSIVEFSKIELAFVKYQIAESCGFPREEQDAIKKEREEVWAGRGMLTFDDAQTDSEIDTNGKMVISSGWTR
jgi:hypothetical protein